MIQQYTPPPTNESRQAVASELLNARGAMLANCGRYILKVGAVLDQAAKKASSKDDDLTPAAREEVLRAEADNKINKIEDCFRRDLLKKKLYTEDGIPPARHPVQVKKAPSQEGSQPSQEAAPTRSLLAEVFVDAEVSTDTHVFERLGVKGCGEEVMAFVKNDSKTVVNIEDGAPDTSSGLVDASKGSQPSKGAWHKARLLSLSLPEATVEAIGMVIVISVDSLRAVSKAKEQKPVILHPSLQLGGVKLNPYDYDFCEEHFILAYDFCEEQFL